MKKVVLSTILAFGLTSSLSAYELNGDFNLKWTGFKLASKVGVSGTFKTINLDIKKSESLTEFLKSAKVKIDTKSLESNDAGRNSNIVSTIFSLASSETIEGTILSVDEAKNSLVLNLVMNQTTKPITMSYEIIDSKVVAKGVIDILDFDLATSYKAFTEVCGALHENVSYSDVNIEFTLPFK